MVNVIDSKCCRNGFISDKYERIQSCMLHLLQNRLPVPLYTSASDGKNVENISGSHIMNVFSALSSHFSMTSVASQKNGPLNANFSPGNR